MHSHVSMPIALNCHCGCKASVKLFGGICFIISVSVFFSHTHTDTALYFLLFHQLALCFSFCCFAVVATSRSTQDGAQRLKHRSHVFQQFGPRPKLPGSYFSNSAQSKGSLFEVCKGMYQTASRDICCVGTFVLVALGLRLPA